MMIGSKCDCLVCQVEKTLIAELSDKRASTESKLLAASSSILSGFTSPLDMVRELHTPEDRNDTSSADRLLLELLKQKANTPIRSICQQLLLLAFIPTIHRTTSQITAVFPFLAREDASQHVVSVFLEILGSSELRGRHSHLAFAIARKLRRQAFRWAIRESRSATPEEMEGDPTVYAEEMVAEEPFYAEVFLRQFLDNCQKTGWLSLEERNLLVRFKIEGASSPELAGRNGHSPVAVRRRIQRLVGRLRRLAKTARWQRAPEQLELFPVSTVEKIFR